MGLPLFENNGGEQVWWGKTIDQELCLGHVKFGMPTKYLSWTCESVVQGKGWGWACTFWKHQMWHITLVPVGPLLISVIAVLGQLL